MSYDLAVSIVTYHTNIETLTKAITSVLKSTLDIKLYVVDNSLINTIGELIKDENITYIFNNDNLGYGKAHNIALKKTINSETPYHIVFNPDIWFDNNVLEELFKYMEEHKDVGNIMPKILYANGEQQYLCKLVPTPFDLIFRRFLPLKKVKEKLNNKYELRFTGYEKLMEVPILSGCFMFLRTESLKNVGLFDDRYFMYLEDVDLSRRINIKYKSIFYPQISIFHGYAKESYSNPKLLKYHAQSAIRYFNKWGWFFDKERSLMNQKVLKL